MDKSNRQNVESKKPDTKSKSFKIGKLIYGEVNQNNCQSHLRFNNDWDEAPERFWGSWQ